MNEELSKKLLDDFPKLFRNRHKTSMQRGFECGDGWFDLIYKISQDIETVARESGLSPDSPEWPLCRQVKEKMGSLRFVVFGIKGFSGVNERISELRLATLNRSLQICEKCGQLGKLEEPMMQWYSCYFSQTWYANTFLVSSPNQIGCAIAHDREWNNIYDSGCNFTCLAIILNIDPGRLASELRNEKYFFEDGSLPADYLDGTQRGLVWDQNAPNSRRKAVRLKDFWHSTLKRRVSLTLQYVGKTSTSDYDEGCAHVDAIRARGNHAVCGTWEHSHLVAGESNEGYFVWDPDGSETTVEQNLAGFLTLRKLFDAYPNQKIEFWEYFADLV